VNALFGIAISSFIVALSGALMPGPLLTTTVGESSRHGPRAGPLLMAGHAILELALVIALFLGLAPLLAERQVKAGVSIAGSAILLWLGGGMLRALPALSIQPQAAPVKRQGRLVATGILVSLSNPYWIIWWATFGLACILQSQKWGFTGIAAFFIGHIAADFSWYSLVSFSVGKGRAFFTDTIYRVVVGVCAVFLLVFAGWFLYKGISDLI
jgi:threonine/homoserine/homoserine lactone efflux protein